MQINYNYWQYAHNLFKTSVVNCAHKEFILAVNDVAQQAKKELSQKSEMSYEDLMTLKNTLGSLKRVVNNHLSFLQILLTAIGFGYMARLDKVVHEIDVKIAYKKTHLIDEDKRFIEIFAKASKLDVMQWEDKVFNNGDKEFYFHYLAYVHERPIEKKYRRIN